MLGAQGRSQKRRTEQGLYIAVISSAADLNQVNCLGVIFDINIKWRYRMEMIEAKAFTALIIAYSLFKSER